jgi:hypothetical protein
MNRWTNLFLGFTFGAGTAAAGTAWIPSAELSSLFSGRTIAGYYADGLKFTERYDRDGAIDYREEGRHLTGTWSIVADTFCTIYANSPTGGCYRVTRTSANCFEFYFQARTEAEAAMPDPGRPSWTARAWHTDRPSTCAEAPTV